MVGRRGNHEGSIFKRPNGSWGASIQVGGKRRYIYGRTRKEVQEKLQVLQGEIRTGVFAVRHMTDQEAPKTVGEFLNYWLEQVVKPNVRPSTWAHYELCVRRMLPYIGAIKLAALTSHDIRAMHIQLHTKDNLARRTVRHCHAVLRNALREATIAH